MLSVPHPGMGQGWSRRNGRTSWPWADPDRGLLWGLCPKALTPYPCGVGASRGTALSCGTKPCRDVQGMCSCSFARCFAEHCQGCGSCLWLTLVFVGIGHSASEVGALPTGQSLLHQGTARGVQCVFSSWHRHALQQGSSSSAGTCKYVCIKLYLP